MFLNKCAILTVVVVTSLSLLLAVAGLVSANVPLASDSHGHAHTHVHDGVTHTHWHIHAGYKDNCNQTYVASAITDVNHDCCCHQAHSHPAPVYALADSGQRWDHHVPSPTHSLPDLWQPVTATSPPAPPIPPPTRYQLDDMLHQLRTVVLLT